MEINPNSKIPALLDRREGANNQRVFESGSILLYLSEAFGGAFLPKVARFMNTTMWGVPSLVMFCFVFFEKFRLPI